MGDTDLQSIRVGQVCVLGVFPTSLFTPSNRSSRAEPGVVTSSLQSSGEPRTVLGVTRKRDGRASLQRAFPSHPFEAKAPCGSLGGLAVTPGCDGLVTLFPRRTALRPCLRALLTPQRPLGAPKGSACRCARGRVPVPSTGPPSRGAFRPQRRHLVGPRHHGGDGPSSGARRGCSGGRGPLTRSGFVPRAKLFPL